MAAASDRRIRVATANHNDSSLQALDEEIHGLVRNYQQLETEIAATNPEYATLTQPKAVTVPELQNHVLDSDTVLLEYDLSPKQSHVWAVTTSSLRVYPLPPEQDIDRTARKAYGLLTARNRRPIESWPKIDETLSEALDRLSAQVLQPVREELSKKRIVIVPDGMLHFIPFSALTTTQSTHTLDREPLVRGHELIALPSASVLNEIRNNNSHRPVPDNFLAVLADPVFSSSDPRVQRLSGGKQSVPHDPSKEVDTTDVRYVKRAVRDIAEDGNGAALSRLLYSREEARQIVRNLPSNRRLIALDFEANRTLATSPELGKYRIVHFATHAFLDERYPEATGLVLSLVDRHGRSQRGFLSLADIYNLRLPVDMVVLSACDTGLGKLVEGEGFIGLTRGFMYAGASRVLASLWKVSDEATAAMMAAFYDELEAKHQAPAAALHNAQQKMLQSARWKSPYYWAGFELQGDWK
jgi:CHAT domain-containing protein